MMTDRFGHMVHEYYVERLRAIMAARAARLDALRTPADARRHVAGVRRAVLGSFGPLPPRTPLHARVTGRTATARLLIEKVIFESRPGFLVTASVYRLPGGGAAVRRPGALVLCGHAGPGKAYGLYAAACQGLALRGFVTMCIDPIEQGERQQYMPGDGGKRPGLCHAHNLMGNQMVLLDDFFGTWRAWDAIRALDYLEARPDVDPRRIGVTGNSGGGTLTAYVAALDPRPAFVAPSCFICSYLANVENELPSDAEQNPPGILAGGLDEADLLLAYAPRPTLVLAQRNDFFDERYARGAAGEIRRIHELLGSRGTARYAAGPSTHGFSIENREAMYGFFCEQAGLKAFAGEQGVEEIPERKLWAAPRGRVDALGSSKVFAVTAERSRRAGQTRGRPGAEGVRREAARVLGIPLVRRTPHYRCLWGSAGQEKGFKVFAQFAVESEPGIRVIVSSLSAEGGCMHPPPGDIRVYVGHLSGLEDVRRLAQIRRMLAGQRPSVVVDPRGIGETAARTCGNKEFLYPYGSDYLYAAQGEMLGESYAGRRVLDVLAALDFLAAGGATSVELIGRGLGAITAAFAGLLHPLAPRVRLIDYLPSYSLIAASPQYSWPLSALVRGCLGKFDLPDVYRALGARLSCGRAWDERMRPIG